MKSKIISGISWMVLLRIIVQFIVIFKLTITARILSPSDFGTFALIATIINSLEALSETGFNYAAIYYKNSLKYFANTLFTINIIRGIVIALVLLFLLNFADQLFNNSLLPKLLLLSISVPLLKGLISPYIIVFIKELDFKKEFLFKLLPNIIGSVSSIIFVISLKNVEGLIYGMILGVMSEVIISYILTSKKVSLQINRKVLKKLFSYGKWMSAGGIFTFMTTQIDNFFIAVVFGPHALGLYDIAYKLSTFVVTEVTDTFAKVLFPYFSKNQNDPIKVRRNFMRSIAFLLIPSLGLFLLLAVFPATILEIVFGKQWTAAAPILAVLAFYGFARAVIGPIGPLFLAHGKPKILSLMSIFNLLLIITFIYPLSLLYGILGVALAVTVSYAIITGVFIFLVFTFFRKNYAKG